MPYGALPRFQDSRESNPAKGYVAWRNLGVHACQPTHLGLYVPTGWQDLSHERVVSVNMLLNEVDLVAPAVGAHGHQG